MTPIRPVDGNNVRNRWRRYSQTRAAYGFSFLPFREWVTGWGRNPQCYKAHRDHADYPVRLTRADSKRGPHPDTYPRTSEEETWTPSST